MLAGLGAVLAFLLLNIEIADYFSSPGSTLTFEFSGNFARDMTYSIAWALFALVLLVAGIARKMPAARYAAMGLLCVTLLQTFPPRSGAARPALPHRRVSRRGGDRHARLVRVSEIFLVRQDDGSKMT